MANEPKTVKRIPQVSFMTTGKVPQASVFPISLSEIKEYVAQTASAAFGKQIRNEWVQLIAVRDENTIYNEDKRANQSSYIISCQIVIPKPFNLYDNPIEVPMVGTFGEYSTGVADFVRKFAKLNNDKKGKKLNDAIKERNNEYIILLSLQAILDQMFDTSGYYYNKAFNETDRPVKVTATFIPKANCINKNTGAYFFGNTRSADNTWCDAEDFIEYVEVIKQYVTTAKGKKHMPITRAKAITIY
jgi:hypothetical protein